MCARVRVRRRMRVQVRAHARAVCVWEYIKRDNVILQRIFNIWLEYLNETLIKERKEK